MWLSMQVAAWCERASKFHEVCIHVNEMFSRLTAIPNRALLYDIYQYTWDAKEATMLLDSYIAWLGKLCPRFYPSFVTGGGGDGRERDKLYFTFFLC